MPTPRMLLEIGEAGNSFLAESVSETISKVMLISAYYLIRYRFRYCGMPSVQCPGEAAEIQASPDNDALKQMYILWPPLLGSGRKNI